MEQEHRNKLKTVQKDHEAKVDVLQQRIKALQKEVATLKKANNAPRQPVKETKDVRELLTASLAAGSSSTPTTIKSRGSGSESESPS